MSFRKFGGIQGLVSGIVPQTVDPNYADPRDAALAKKIRTVLEPFQGESRENMIEEIAAAIDSGQDLAGRLDLLGHLHALLGERQDVLLRLDDVLERTGLMPLVVEIERRAKDLILPDPNTAANVETLHMSYAYWLTTVSETAPSELALAHALNAALHRSPLVARCRDKLALFGNFPEKTELVMFSRGWFKAAFPRLEVGHKLAAALCLTDIPDDVDVHAPWPAWSLVVPDGLLGDIARVWCEGPEPSFTVTRSGAFRSSADDAEPRKGMLRDLVRGACLALSNPDDFKKERQHGPTARSSKKLRHGPPDLQQARFLLSAPVQVDFREHIASVLTGKSHASPTVQFLVRGHARNQAHGPRHELRKSIWIQPFWKGPEGSRILLRQHRVEEPTEKDPS